MKPGRATPAWPKLALPIALMAASFVLSSIPGDDEQTTSLLGFVPPAVQNLLHVPLFALLAWSWCRALSAPARAAAQVLAVAALISIGWSIFDELHQLYVPGRYASLTDLGLNFGGIAIGLGWFAQRQRN